MNIADTKIPYDFSCEAAVHIHSARGLAHVLTLASHALMDPVVHGGATVEDLEHFEMTARSIGAHLERALIALDEESASHSA